MDIDEPVKTACGQTLREATGTITLHISASLSADNVSYDLASVDADLPITVEVVNNNGTIMPKVDSVGFTRILTAGINAFTNAIAEYDDPALMQAALGNVAKARGMTQIAKDAGVGRESLYKSLSKDGNPSFQTIAKVIHALGGRLTIQAA